MQVFLIGRDGSSIILHAENSLDKIVSKQVKADVVIGDDQQGVKTVAGNPNSIGYVSIGSTAQSIKQSVKVKLLTLDSIKAITTVADKSFPLLRRLNLMTKGQPTDGNS